MICSKCKIGEIEAAGSCPYCGYSTVKKAQTATLPFPPLENVFSFPVEKARKPADFAPHLRIVKEKAIPSWRLEVSQKVQEVLRMREARGAVSPAAGAVSQCMNAVGGSSPGVSPAAESAVVATLPPIKNTDLAGSITVHPPAKPKRPVRSRQLETKVNPLFADSLLDVEAVRPPIQNRPPDAPATDRSVDAPLPSDHKADTLSANSAAEILLEPAGRALGLDYQPESQPAAAVRKCCPQDGGVLLSRTLAGLIDLIVILFCSIPFFFTMVYLLSYEDVDEFSLFTLLGITICLFCLYSTFFLALCGQTIGMMITGLQVVAAGGALPTYTECFIRFLGFLLGVGGGGLGFIWGLFDSQHRCLQDLLSGTHVVRLSGC